MVWLTNKGTPVQSNLHQLIDNYVMNLIGDAVRSHLNLYVPVRIGRLWKLLLLNSSFHKWMFLWNLWFLVLGL